MVKSKKKNGPATWLPFYDTGNKTVVDYRDKKKVENFPNTLAWSILQYNAEHIRHQRSNVRGSKVSQSSETQHLEKEHSSKHKYTQRSQKRRW